MICIESYQESWCCVLKCENVATRAHWQAVETLAETGDCPSHPINMPGEQKPTQSGTDSWGKQDFSQGSYASAIPV